MPAFRNPVTATGTQSCGLLRVIVLLAALVAPATVAAHAVEPHQLVNEVIQRVMAKVETINPARDQADGLLLSVFEQELSPYLDFDTITQWLVGARWAEYSEAERIEFVAAVRDHIARVYAALLARGRSVTIQIEPTSTVLTRSAKVGAELATADGRTLDVEFRLLRSGESWKLYDLVVAGLSFARSLRAELAPVIDAGGVVGLKTYLGARQ